MSNLPSKDDVARRSGLMSRALADAARRARFSTRTRRNLAGGGLQARRGARLMRLVAVGSFLALVAIPTLAATIYYGFAASDQYVAEAQFTVMGGDAPKAPGADGLSASAGVPVAVIMQDTQILASFLESRSVVEALETRLGLRKLYGDDSIDFFSRFGPEESVERLVRYWRSMSKTTISMPSGIVDFHVRAFSPEAARRIAETVVELSEQLINDLNARLLADAVTGAEAEAKRASARLAAARGKLEQARNDEGVLDANRAAQSIEKLLLELRSGQLAMQQEYQAMLRSVNDSAPQMRALRARIDAARAQIVDLESKLTAARAGDERTLASSMTRFAELDLERQIAERLYAGAIATLEAARLTSETRLMYLKTFVLPRTPEEPLYPKRVLYPALILAGGLAAWAVLIGLAGMARDNMA